MAQRTSQEPTEVITNSTSANERVSQQPTEVSTFSSSNVRVSQLPPSFITYPTSEKARASQLAVEVAISPGIPYVSQIAVEVMIFNPGYPAFSTIPTYGVAVARKESIFTY